MKVFLIIFFLLNSLYSSDFENEEIKKEYDVLSFIIIKNLGNRLEPFDGMNLKYIVKMNIDKNYKIKYTPFKKSTNEKYNQVIEDFIRQENGKIYFLNVDKKIKPFYIDFIPKKN